MSYNPFDLLGEQDRMIREWEKGGDFVKCMNDFLLGGLNLATTPESDPLAELMGGSVKQLFPKEEGGF